MSAAPATPPRSRELLASVAAVVGLGLLFLRPVPQHGVHHIELLLAMALLIHVPLLLAAVADGGASRLHEAAAWLQPPAALAATASLLLEPGAYAAALVVPWFLVAVLVALEAVVRFRRSGMPTMAGSCIDAGRVYLSVGAAWLLASRSGMQPLGFREPLVLLTAVHFHFAGFATAILTGLAGRVGDGGRSRLFRVIAVGVIAGLPLVAIGMTLSPLVELIGVLVLAAALLLFAWFLGFRVSARVEPRWARFLLRVSAAFLVPGMVLAVVWGAAEFVGTAELLGMARIDIDTMVPAHGMTNALGFAFTGALAWRGACTNP